MSETPENLNQPEVSEQAVQSPGPIIGPQPVIDEVPGQSTGVEPGVEPGGDPGVYPGGGVDSGVDTVASAEIEAQVVVKKDVRPRQLALMNQKGGVGKTTTAVNLGAGLASLGYRVLLIDLDPQAHLTLHLGIDPESLERSVYDLLVDDQARAAEVTQQVGENLFVIPSEVNLAGAETELAPKMATGMAQRILRNKLDTDIETNEYDYTIIDCPPSLGLLTINALTVANEVIVPMQAHFLSLQGLSKLLETVSLIRQSFNPRLVVAGIVLCMHESQTILSKEVVSDLESFLEESRGADVPWSDAVMYNPAIRRNIKLAECPSFGQTVFDYASDCNGAKDYAGLAKSVAGVGE